MKIESCKAGFSACGGSRSDKFLFAAVRSTRSAFCFIGNATQFPIKQKSICVKTQMLFQNTFSLPHLSSAKDRQHFSAKIQTQDQQ